MSLLARDSPRSRREPRRSERWNYAFQIFTYRVHLTDGGWNVNNETSEAERWEQGSRADEMRNSFIVPEVARIVETHRPKTILDVGAGTGYIARAIHERLSYQPRWVLLDRNEERLRLATAHRRPDMALEVVAGNVFCWPLGERRFDAVIITFTLLEIDDIERLCTLLASHMEERAVLALAMPDAWVDVLEYSKKDPGIVERYMESTSPTTTTCLKRCTVLCAAS